MFDPTRRLNTRPITNPFAPPIPAPTTDVNNLRACVEALKAGVESLIGQRGDANNRAVTFNDMIGFGLLTPQATASPGGGASTGVNLITIGNGLYGTPNPITEQGTIYLATPVSVANGGTGATTAAAAPWVEVSGDTMTGSLTVNGTVLSTSTGSSGQFRMAPNTAGTGYGSFWRNDSATTYLLLTNNNDAFGTWNGLRPFNVENANGRVHMAHGLALDGSSSTNYLACNGPGSNLKIFDDGNSHIEASVGLWLNGNTLAPVTCNGPMYINNMLNTNGINARSNIIMTGDAAGGTGQMLMYPGGPSNSGYLGWMKPNNTRQAYMGYDQSNLVLQIEQGGFRIVGNTSIGGDDTGPVHPLTVWKAATNDPLEVKADQGYYARMTFHQKFVRIWSLGQDPSGQLLVADESASAVRLTIATNGIGYWGVGTDAPTYYSGGYKTCIAGSQHHQLFRPDGWTAIFLSQDNGGTNYYRNVQHRFDHTNGTNWVVFDSNVHINSGNVYMDGGGTIFLNNNTHYYVRDTANNIQPMIGMLNDNRVYIASGGHETVTSNHTRPSVNNAHYSGHSGFYWYQSSAYTFFNPSDRREKKDIRDLPDRCLELVRAIVPQRFRWNHGIDQEKTHWGFIAQDVGETMASKGLEFGGHKVEEDGTQGLAMTELVAVLWRAVQELEIQVAALKGG